MHFIRFHTHNYVFPFVLYNLISHLAKHNSDVFSHNYLIIHSSRLLPTLHFCTFFYIPLYYLFYLSLCGGSIKSINQSIIYHKAYPNVMLYLCN